MNLYNILPSAIIGIISSLIAAYFSSKWAVSKFYKERWWERKDKAYEELINALYDLLQFCEIEKSNYGEPTQYNDDKYNEIVKGYSDGIWKIKKISAIQNYYYSNNVCRILEELNNRPVLEWNENPPWEIYESEYIAYKSALSKIINYAKKDLSK